MNLIETAADIAAETARTDMRAASKDHRRAITMQRRARRTIARAIEEFQAGQCLERDALARVNFCWDLLH
ncbi:MAG: hypothetical protein AB7R89_19020 [Dehalococcoidia bacterium]